MAWSVMPPLFSSASPVEGSMSSSSVPGGRLAAVAAGDVVGVVFVADGGLVGVAVGGVGLDGAGGDAGAGPGVEAHGSGVDAGGLFGSGISGGVGAGEYDVVVCDVER